MQKFKPVSYTHLDVYKRQTYDKTVDPSDGYANYQVTYDAALYSENGGPYTSCLLYTS